MATRRITSLSASRFSGTFYASAKSSSTQNGPARNSPARRSAGRVALAAALWAFPAALAAILAAPAASFAQANDAPPEIEKGVYRLEAQVTTATYVRSGPGDNFYPTQHLDKGATVIVVGKKNTWLVIQPPEGSYSLVQRQYIDRRNDGTVGRVKAPNQIVHAGSTLQPQLQWAVQTKLEVGQDVAILAEENQYFKIKPPESAYLFISADAVTAVRKLPKDGGKSEKGEKPADPSDTARGGGTDVISGTGRGVPTPAPTVLDESRATAPVTHPAVAGGASDVAVAPVPSAPAAPATRPAVSESFSRLQKLESEFTAASAQPLPDQPIEALLAGYERLAAAPGVPEPTRKMAGARASTLKVRAQVREEYLAMQKQQQEDQQKRQAQIAEQEELEERIKKLDVHVYAAVGTLRPSSLQVGNGQGKSTLYRLTDPGTGRTVVYLRSNDPKYADMIGQFVGVKGQVGTEPQLNLRVVAPTGTEVVDPSKVNGSVAAEIIPPSLQARTPTASTGQ